MSNSRAPLFDPQGLSRKYLRNLEYIRVLQRFDLAIHSFARRYEDTGWSGVSIAAVPDLDGDQLSDINDDGWPDLLIGANKSPRNQDSDAGAAWAVLGVGF